MYALHSFIQTKLCKSVADTGGLQWFQLKPPLKIVRVPNLLTSRHVGDKITTSYTQCVTEGLSTGETSYFCL